MKYFFKIIIIFALFAFITACNVKYRDHIQSKKDPLKVYVAPTKVAIDIFFLRSISSSIAEGEGNEILIKKISENHARWFDVRFRRVLLDQGIAVVSKEKADLILEPNIVDMGEVRPKVFLQGLSIGLVLGFIAGELTGKPEVGLAVFAWEVVEEIIIVYLLKSYFMITTIDLEIKTAEGLHLASKEFTAYSNDEFEELLPDFTKKLRENKVRGSLDKNAREIADFLKSR